MKTAVFSTKSYDRQYIRDAAGERQSFSFLEPRLTRETAQLAEGHEAVCVFVHDRVDRAVLDALAEMGCRLVAIRAAGYNNVDLEAARERKVAVVRVPAYSPDGVAEFTVGLMLTLNRGMHRAHDRIRRGNFSLDGLMGFNMRNKTAGVIGTGKIGSSVARILMGFGCQVLAFDAFPDEQLAAEGVRYVDFETLLQSAHIVTLHVPLLDDTRHLINAHTLARMRDGVMLINTSRGELVETGAAIEALKSGKLGALGIDVYEDEEGIFFEDLSNAIVADDRLMRLTTFPNTLVTSHQAFFTREAMENIARVTVGNIDQFERTGSCDNAL